MDFADIRKQINNVQKVYSDTCYQIAYTAFQEFFTEFSEVKEIRFTAYTPYWALHGEQCEYSVNEFQLEIKDEFRASLGLPIYTPDASDDEDEDEYFQYGTGDQYIRDFKISRRGSEIISAMRQLEQVIGNEDMLMQVVGDHVKVVASIDGFNIRPYEHE